MHEGGGSKAIKVVVVVDWNVSVVVVVVDVQVVPSTVSVTEKTLSVMVVVSDAGITEIDVAATTIVSMEVVVSLVDDAIVKKSVNVEEPKVVNENIMPGTVSVIEVETFATRKMLVDTEDVLKVVVVVEDVEIVIAAMISVEVDVVVVSVVKNSEMSGN